MSYSKMKKLRRKFPSEFEKSKTEYYAVSFKSFWICVEDISKLYLALPSQNM